MVMLSCVSKNEEVRMALEATSASLPAPALDAPPALVITMDASVPNWPWEMLVLVNLTQFSDDDE
jgi:hypothetical protein